MFGLFVLRSANTNQPLSGVDILLIEQPLLLGDNRLEQAAVSGKINSKDISVSAFIYGKVLTVIIRS